jgi:hypothetical protein
MEIACRPSSDRGAVAEIVDEHAWDIGEAEYLAGTEMTRTPTQSNDSRSVGGIEVLLILQA